MTRRVGQHTQTVAGLARQLGVGWHTVMCAVTAVGTPLVNDPARLGGVNASGVDEHAWQQTNQRRHTQFATGIVDLTPRRAARLLEVTPGRSGAAYADWLGERGRQWRAQIKVARARPFPWLPDRPRHPPARGHPCPGRIPRS